MFNFKTLFNKKQKVQPIQAKIDPSTQQYSDLPSLVSQTPEVGNIINSRVQTEGQNTRVNLHFREYMHTMQETYDTIYPAGYQPAQFQKISYSDMNAVNLNDSNNTAVLTGAIEDEDLENLTKAFGNGF